MTENIPKKPICPVEGRECFVAPFAIMMQVNVRPMSNTLFYGDNLQVLRGLVPDESVDFGDLRPAFSSNASFNVLIKAG